MTIRAFEYDPLPSPQPEAPALPNASELTARYQELRAQKSALETQMKAVLKPISEEMVKIEGELMNVLNVTGSKNLSTDNGTAYKSERRTYSIEDPHAYREWVEANHCPHFYENRPSKEALDLYAEEHGTLPPGIKVSSFVTVNIRAK